jgi:hypothetical protein
MKLAIVLWITYPQEADYYKTERISAILSKAV